MMRRACDARRQRDVARPTARHDNRRHHDDRRRRRRRPRPATPAAGRATRRRRRDRRPRRPTAGRAPASPPAGGGDGDANAARPVAATAAAEPPRRAAEPVALNGCIGAPRSARFGSVRGGLDKRGVSLRCRVRARGSAARGLRGRASLACARAAVCRDRRRHRRPRTADYGFGRHVPRTHSGDGGESRPGGAARRIPAAKPTAWPSATSAKGHGPAVGPHDYAYAWTTSRRDYTQGHEDHTERGAEGRTRQPA